MTLSIITPPAAEPVALADAKSVLRITTDVEDALLGALIVAARMRIEAELGLAMLTTGFRETFHAFPDGAVALARGPLTAVAAVSVADSSGVFSPLAAADYLPSLGSRPGAITPVNIAWPTPGIAVDGVRIDYTAGFGPDPADVPAPLVQAILRLVAYAFDHRGEAADPAPIALVEPWLAPYRRIRL
jgi:uncharacterized phiE125 gp8 family phage protein